MLTSQKKSSRVQYKAFVDYRPAELRIGKDWIIVYYAKNPITGNLDRYRVRVPVMQGKTVRTRFAKKMVHDINTDLSEGWTPALESGNNYKPFTEALDDFVKYVKKQIKDNVMRPDTQRTYNSNINLIKEFVEKKNIEISFAMEINKAFCVKYIDWIYLDRAVAPVTRNNHLAFLRLLCTYFVNQGILKENPTVGISQLKVGKKKRTPIPDKLKKRIIDAMNQIGKEYACLGMTTYYCLVRNTELTKLKVGMISIINSTLFIPGDVSKNKKDEYVTIPDPMLKLLIDHIKRANKNDYLFSSDDFRPGKKKLSVRKLNDKWERVRDIARLPDSIQFYSLKDTGITDLFNAGVPAIKIRDQARHHDIKITELYTERGKGGVAEIKKAKIEFC
ncbi:tyrosine-type recombinase/integrase [Flavobacterium sp. CAU 1735]|uniref:tyrosine-type recombinase/integrase n=1 Tax=Flavobacterium sp. CAU 1735 TaxID=3140361 RepID=UPI0032603275